MTMPIERSIGIPPAKDTSMEMEDDEKTVQTKGNGTKIEEKLMEFTMKLTFRPKYRKMEYTQTKVLKIHYGLCNAILNVSGNITIIDNAKEEHTTVATMTQTNKQFKPKKRDNNNHWIIIMHVHGDISLSVIKNHYAVHELLRAEKHSIKKWPERTSTSPSGTHLGHYHVLWRYRSLPEDVPKGVQVIAGQEFLIDCHVAMLNYSLKFGHSFDRWKDVVNVMLMKDPGNPKIHRLRVIHLYEADYNLLLAVKWRSAMHHAEDHHLLNDGLYGSRAGPSAHEPVFIELLQNEIYKVSMKPGINFDLDATSCYDRILAAIAAVTSRAKGMTKHIVAVCAKTLEEARFRLKTSLPVEGYLIPSTTIV
jgi:hypothetical protein